MIQKNSLARFARLLAATIEGLDEQQIDQLLTGKGKLTFTATENVRQISSGPSLDQTAILEKLNGLKDRDEARQVLSQITNRDALASLARALKIHVIKHDRREDIESKIIEFVIGGKLRTEAIQSLNLKGGNGGLSDE